MNWSRNLFYELGLVDQQNSGGQVLTLEFIIFWFDPHRSQSHEKILMIIGQKKIYEKKKMCPKVLLSTIHHVVIGNIENNSKHIDREDESI